MKEIPVLHAVNLTQYNEIMKAQYSLQQAGLDVGFW